MHIRTYQSKAISDLRTAYAIGRRALLLVAPTGAGKTVMFASMIESAVSKGLRVLVLVHRRELIGQVSRAVHHLDHGIIAAGRQSNPLSPVQVASVQTLVNRLESVAAPDLIVIDEAHHAAASTWERILERWPRAWRLGVTATPERLDGQGLRGLFEDIVLGPSVTELQAAGYLCPTRYFAPAGIDASKLKTRLGDYVMADAERAGRRILGDVVETYNTHAAGKRAVAFCATIDHAREQAAAFGSGWECLHSGLTTEARDNMVRRFTAGELTGLTSVDIISEGFDLPAIEVAILLRPTKSLSLHLQQIGRALRPFEGKNAALILDHVGNWERHGFAETEREWSLDGEEARKAKEPPRSIGKRCPQCYFVNPHSALECGDCGALLEKQTAEIQVVPAEMRELTREPYVRPHVREVIGDLGLRPPLLLREWRVVADRLGYKQGWAWHQFQNQKSKPKS